MPALDPALNLRCFATEHAASLRAAGDLLPGFPEAQAGPLSVIVEGCPEPAGSSLAEWCRQQGVCAHAVAPRVWLSGSAPRLGALAQRLADSVPILAAELAAALAAFTAPPVPPRVMGILNVTPDSFSDGGLWLDPERAVERGLEMVAEGADILDLGGESTRPGAEPVSAAEELRRVLPVLEGLRPRTQGLISIDTQKAAVARVCLEAGADWINDVSGLTHDPSLAAAVAAFPGRKLVLMHSRRRPAAERYSTEYDAAGQPVYEDVVADTLRWLRHKTGRARGAGVAAADLWLDPGFGFGKTFEQNIELLRRVREYRSAGVPLLIGTSRKSSVGRLVGDLPPEDRREGTAATVAWAVAAGVDAVRVHDVREMARIVRATAALR